MMETKNLFLETETIKLGQMLKKADITSSGGQVKQMLAEGKIKVNGEAEYRRGRKLEPGDLVEIEGQPGWRVCRKPL
jgi:ribosome-associated protein